MRKFFLKVFLFFLSLPAIAKSDGCVFFNVLGNWRHFGVYVNNDFIGDSKHGIAFFCLEPGDYQISTLKKYFRGHSSSSALKINPNINFTIKQNTLTSIGTIILYQKIGSSSGIYLKNNDLALAYVERFYPERYKKFIGRKVLNAFLPYQNKHLNDIKREFFLKNYESFSLRGNLFSGPLGILMDVGKGADSDQKSRALVPEGAYNLSEDDDNAVLLIDTGTMDKLSLPLGRGQLEKTVLLGSFNNLFSYDGKVFEVIPIAKSHMPYVVAQTKNWLFTIDMKGNLSKTKDFGQTWETIDTEISDRHPVRIVAGFSNNKFIFGPLTHTQYKKTYKKRVGYIVEGDSAEVKKIKWSKYVTVDSRFYSINNTIYMDPVTLGDKAFLFYYQEDKNKWKEVKLPNRRCKIEGNEDRSTIILKCQKGKSYSFSGVGSEWKKINTN